MSFTTLNLTGERVLVKGTDAQGTTGEVVLDASEWNEVKRHVTVADAQENFDAKVEEFFAPLMLAAEQMQDAFKRPEIDPISYVTIHEGTEAVQGRDEITIKLSSDSIVLRLIEEGDTDRLVWVADRLEVLEVLPVQAQRAVSGGTEPHDGEGWTSTPVDEV